MPEQDLNARICRCGHTAHWHNALIATGTVPGGTGECEGGAACGCKRFDLDHEDTLNSLRAELARLRSAVEAELRERWEGELLSDEAHDREARS